MTLWQHIKEDGGFGLFDYLGSRVAFTAAQWERWYAMPVCMLVGALLTLVAIPVTFAWLLVHLCIWAYRRVRRLLRPLWVVLMVRAGWPHPYPKPEEGKRDE